MKRAFDVVFSLFGIVLTLPLAFLLIPILLFAQGRPIFFLQTRIGLHGKAFRLIKFRTMTNTNKGQLITVAGDTRVTSVGAILRKFKIDEFPQLLNVLRGEMSFVGPRPEVLHYVNMYSDEQRRVLEFKPGITDPASLIYFDESEILKAQADPEEYYVNVLMPEKIQINMAYGLQASFCKDLKLIAATVLRIFGLRLIPFKSARAV